MKTAVIALTCLLFVGGCFSVVEHQKDMSRVRSFIITDDEALDTLERAAQTGEEQKKHLFSFPDAD